MARPRKDQQVPDLAGDIKEAAWQQIAADGVQALSLRAIARRLGITAPAIYHYFPSRDELVIALVIEAFDSLAKAQASATASTAEAFAQLQAIGLSYRSWAISNPQRYQLIFGAPLPGYQLLRKQVLRSSARAISELVSVIEVLRRLDRLKSGKLPDVKIGDKTYYKQLQETGIEADKLSLTVAVLIWSRLHGLVSLELSGNLPDADGEALLRYELSAIHKQFFRNE